MNAAKTKYTGALYYPYIHIRDLNWLRANLIIFPFVKRMVPMNFTPLDHPGVKEFTQEWRDPKGNKTKPALLQPADLSKERIRKAQRVLAAKLRDDLKTKGFAEKYGQKAARKLVPKNDLGFQIHTHKLAPELSETLLAGNKLAWKPLNPEPYGSQSAGYIEVHPRVGEVVMSTIAVACAQSSALDIVGDKRSGPLHQCLLEKNLDDVYSSWLDSDIHHMDAPKAASGEELMEFILGIPGDLSTLTVAKLHQLAEGREAIDALIANLREHAAEIPAMDEGEEREAAFKQATSDVMKEWEKDRRNLRGFARAFFGFDLAKTTTDFAGKIADKTVNAIGPGPISAGAGWLGSLATGGLIGAAAGFVVGLIAHGGFTYYKETEREKNSPYRFLTTLEDAGVVFRSEISGRKK